MNSPRLPRSWIFNFCDSTANCRAFARLLPKYDCSSIACFRPCQSGVWVHYPKSSSFSGSSTKSRLLAKRYGLSWHKLAVWRFKIAAKLRPLSGPFKTSILVAIKAPSEFTRNPIPVPQKVWGAGAPDRILLVYRHLAVQDDCSTQPFDCYSMVSVIVCCHDCHFQGQGIEDVFNGRSSELPAQPVPRTFGG